MRTKPQLRPVNTRGNAMWCRAELGNIIVTEVGNRFKVVELLDNGFIRVEQLTGVVFRGETFRWWNWFGPHYQIIA